MNNKLDTNPRLEALLEAVGILKGWQNPDSYTYQIKNPLQIKSFAPTGKHEIDKDGLRVFSNWLGGYRACLYDLAVKVAGRSRAGLRDSDTLTNLLKVYGIQVGLGQDQVVKYLRRATRDQTITKDQPLEYFRS